MLHHVSVGVSDVERAAKFYDAVLGALGYKRVMEFLPHAIAYGERHPSFWVQVPADRNAATAGNGTHVGFSARSKQQVQKFHAAALQQGGSNNGEPGPRPDYGPDYYGAFIYDLDGNKIEAVLNILVSDVAKPARKTAARKKTAKKAAKKTARKAAKKPAKKTKKKVRR